MLIIHGLERTNFSDYALVTKINLLKLVHAINSNSKVAPYKGLYKCMCDWIVD